MARIKGRLQGTTKITELKTNAGQKVKDNRNGKESNDLEVEGGRMPKGGRGREQQTSARSPFTAPEEKGAAKKQHWWRGDQEPLPEGKRAETRE